MASVFTCFYDTGINSIRSFDSCLGIRLSCRIWNIIIINISPRYKTFLIQSTTVFFLTLFMETNSSIVICKLPHLYCLHLLFLSFIRTTNSSLRCFTLSVLFFSTAKESSLNFEDISSSICERLLFDIGSL